MNAAHLHKLKQLYTPSQAARTLSWLSEFCTTEKNPAACLARCVDQHVDQHEPLAYILGTQPFGQHLDLRVRRPTLIPRPETEEWASRLARLLSLQKDQLNVLEVGTGTGCIPLLLSSEVPNRHAQLNLVSLDKSASALALAQENLALHADLCQHPVQFFQADLFSDEHLRSSLGQQRFDLVVSNPPYISTQEHTELEPSVRLWEDVAALVPSSTPSAATSPTADGLECYRRIADVLPQWIRPKNRTRLKVVLEVGWKQADAVSALLLERSGVVKRTEVWSDMHGFSRTVLGWA